MLHQVHAVGFFALPVIVRLQPEGEIALQLLRELLAAGRFGVEDLRAMVFALGKKVLMDAEQQRLLQPEYQKKLAAVIAGTLSVWLSEEHPNEI